ncbi:23S rRNA (adenine(2030)-N(6))-methyltransferase RlmJ, partial [Acidocella aminolytica]
VIWYPIKHRAPVRQFFEALKLAGLKDVIAAELLRRPDTDPTKLNGTGLAIINPPYGFEDEAAPILQACLDAFGEAGASASVERIIHE